MLFAGKPTSQFKNCNGHNWLQWADKAEKCCILTQIKGYKWDDPFYSSLVTCLTAHSAVDSLIEKVSEWNEGSKGWSPNKPGHVNNKELPIDGSCMDILQLSIVWKSNLRDEVEAGRNKLIPWRRSDVFVDSTSILATVIITKALLTSSSVSSKCLALPFHPELLLFQLCVCSSVFSHGLFQTLSRVLITRGLAGEILQNVRRLSGVQRMSESGYTDNVFFYYCKLYKLFQVILYNADFNYWSDQTSLFVYMCLTPCSLFASVFFMQTLLASHGWPVTVPPRSWSSCWMNCLENLTKLPRWVLLTVFCHYYRWLRHFSLSCAKNCWCIGQLPFVGMSCVHSYSV